MYDRRVKELHGAAAVVSDVSVHSCDEEEEEDDLQRAGNMAESPTSSPVSKLVKTQQQRQRMITS